MPKKIETGKKKFSLSAFLVDTFGMKSHFIRALFVLWVTSCVGLIFLNLLGWKHSSPVQVVIYILSTALVVLVSSFSATCFMFGDCPRAAYASASMGILIISVSALSFN